MESPQSASVTPEHVTEFLRKGAKPETVTRLLVATGAWSQSGAEEIVSTLATQPVDAAQESEASLGGRGLPTTLPRCSLAERGVPHALERSAPPPGRLCRPPQFALVREAHPSVLGEDARGRLASTAMCPPGASWGSSRRALAFLSRELAGLTTSSRQRDHSLRENSGDPSQVLRMRWVDSWAENPLAQQGPGSPVAEV